MVWNRHQSLILASCAALASLVLACSSNSPTDPNGNGNGNGNKPVCAVVTVGQTTTAFTAAGGTGSIPVTGDPACQWSATSSAAFLTITSGATGSGNGSVAFTVAANTGAARTASVSIANQVVNFSQAAGAGTITGTLAAPTASAPAEGSSLDSGTPTLVVTNSAATGTVGTVTYRFEISDLSTFPNDPARTFTQDGIAQGNGTTSWVVNHNLGPSVLWFWHAQATGTSAATSAFSNTASFRTKDAECNYTVSPTTVSSSAAGDSAPLTITRTTGNCTWTATTDAGWISGPSSGGPGAFTYSFAANPAATTPAPRTGHITIAWTGGSAVVTVNQGAGLIQCSYALINPSDGSAQQSAGASGGSFNANLTASPAGCNWQLSIDQAAPAGMLSISSPTTGSGNTTMGFSVSALPPSGVVVPRTGLIRVQTTVAGRTGSAVYTVKQP